MCRDQVEHSSVVQYDLGVDLQGSEMHRMTNVTDRVFTKCDRRKIENYKNLCEVKSNIFEGDERSNFEILQHH